MLVVGAIAGVTAVVSTQFPPSRSSQSAVAVETATAPDALAPDVLAPDVPAPDVQVTAAKADDLAWLGNLVGIAQFVKNPTQYRFVQGEAPGQVTDASLEGNVMTIAYRYPAEGEVMTGELIGTVDADGLFVGTYQAHSPKGLMEGDITMTFVADGTAEGSYGDGTGITRIVL